MTEGEEAGAKASRVSFLLLPAGCWGSRARGIAIITSLVGASGCGGGLPLLHPARALAPGDLRASAGLSGNVAVGAFADAARRAVELAAADATAMPSAAGTTGDPSQRAAAMSYAEGALVAASLGAGLAPLVSARVGLAGKPGSGGYEGGIMYTGRAARADLRRVFDLSARWALSVGAGGSAVLYG
ncbi:MAG: hypothetical protein M3O50_18005, partial [Myxococcota bacterium]|nr:hypothetical protein [Myxococcota bacterium]